MNKDVLKKSKIKIELEIEKNCIGNSIYCLATTKGKLKNMDDRYVVDLFLNNPIYIILDGHRGHQVAEYCKRNIINILNDLYNYSELKEEVEKIKYVFNKLTKKLEEELIQYSMEHISGSTITIIYLLPDNILVLNIGDSKSLLIYNNYTYKELTTDHKPYITLERKRIEKAKGKISNGLINNDLNVSRTLGDFKYKSQKSLLEHEQIIINTPYIQLYTINKLEKYLIISNSSIWDLFTNQKMIDFIEHINKKGEYDTKKIIELVVKKSIKEGNINNIIYFIIEL